ncbi:PfkB family carbohydrate kinase [Pontibacillus marinus]|uniref:Carbohydrate kinase n=1 Tax=Pontibacillus marinus BH030004 = DSM 16465 TaxID=1385511 RepID=A0A0A5GIB0_9BACI|nr:PfkB family carbohydrate kinase [Pontibacillus marinus]KGX91754.1 carbohydrate kinase [Pontibacillus marinus BH030004 = DSM 16465]
MKMVTIGNNIADVYLDQKTMYPGGNALNVAVMSKMYGAKKSSYIGIIGSDDIGDYMLQTLQNQDVNISRVRRAYGESGQAFVNLNSHNDRIFVDNNRGGIQNDLSLKINEKDLDLIEEHDILHTSLYSNSDDHISLLSKHIPISYDFSNHYTYDHLERICPYVSFAFISGSHLSEHEIEETINLIHGYGTNVVVITRGDKGANASLKGTTYYQDIEPVDVVDSLGAGDSFIAGFLKDYLDHNQMTKALETGAQKAAITCTVNGAFGNGKRYSPL